LPIQAQASHSEPTLAAKPLSLPDLLPQVGAVDCYLDLVEQAD
jgi:hypothetical protein